VFLIFRIVWNKHYVSNQWRDAVFGTIFAQKPYLEHNRKFDDLWADFKIAEGCSIRHGLDANIQHDIGQFGLF